ncbi:DUF3786 domain-containing protein [Desulfoprunum benzoelyticum]|uniref:DUF3786 domain-containing protein n=1 Tax=Desulfoprunum benzoelyticum TaxID=1506996 RepID=A0A840UZA5_9BACT|nr:DUF3786 domain-containing protein [Desulfoprunum benzoelyticum]MBB5346321.1 hypothetical protein [Desulfoprunum benzoelyticum]MBM9528680.1 DUF3786 domain-containing protein [Desulfoprunum benzoelyticum]
MPDNYAILVQDNLDRLYRNLPDGLANNLPGEQNGDRFVFTAFGERCVIEPKRITLGKTEHSSVFGILISLYALNACSDICVPAPFRSFKEFPDSMPYVGAFTTHTEQVLVPYVARIKESVPSILEALNGEKAPPGTGGDFSFTVYPLPKIALCYIFYEADDDFPASATCLYSSNANIFMPMDGLADVGEYTSKKIINLKE